MSYCFNSAAADDEAARLDYLDRRDELRAAAILETSNQMQSALAGALVSGDLYAEQPDWTTERQNPARKVEVETMPIDIFYDLASYESGNPEVKVLLAALLASDAAAPLRQAVCHANAARNAADVAEARNPELWT
jgi:hypothetical protein